LQLRTVNSKDTKIKSNGRKRSPSKIQLRRPPLLNKQNKSIIQSTNNTTNTLSTLTTSTASHTQIIPRPGPVQQKLPDQAHKPLLNTTGQEPPATSSSSLVSSVSPVNASLAIRHTNTLRANGTNMASAFCSSNSRYHVKIKIFFFYFLFICFCFCGNCLNLFALVLDVQLVRVFLQRQARIRNVKKRQLCSENSQRNVPTNTNSYNISISCL